MMENTRKNTVFNITEIAHKAIIALKSKNYFVDDEDARQYQEYPPNPLPASPLGEVKRAEVGKKGYAPSLWALEHYVEEYIADFCTVRATFRQLSEEEECSFRPFEEEPYGMSTFRKEMYEVGTDKTLFLVEVEYV
ncbi:hypothetical protein M1N64_03550 [Peptococcaceae bacterium]|nr:hypothetical protein [Peptococcaceae bacterium]